MTLEDLNFVTRRIKEFIDNEGLEEDLKGSELRLSELRRGAYDANTILKATEYNNDFINKLRLFSTVLWSDQEIDVLNKLGFSKLFGNHRENFLSSHETFGNTNSTIAIKDIESIVGEFKKALKIIEVTTDLLDSLELTEDKLKPKNDDFGVIEITFDKDVSIDNFDDARSQMKSWYLIIEGYSRLLNIPREEFVIIGFSKNSPTSIKVQVNIDAAKVIAAIGTFLLGVYGMNLANVKSIDTIESSVLISDEVKMQMVDTLRGSLSAGIESQIKEIVDKEIAKYYKGHKDVEEVRVALTKGLTQQFSFTQNGGDINLYIGGNEQNEEIKQFEKTKQEIQLLERGVSKQKLIEDTLHDDDENDEKHGDYLNLED